MKYRKWALGVGMLEAWCCPAGARTTSVETFLPASSPAFHMLQPGYEAPGNDVEMLEQPDPMAMPIDLAAEFNGLAGTYTPPTSRIVVPDWMRGRDDIASQFAGLSSQTLCSVPSYRPHASLSAVEEVRRARYFSQVADAACRAGVPVDLYDALIIQESRYNPSALSPKGASGMAQLMPETARTLGVWDRWSIRQNLDGGARYLREQLNIFGSWALALSAYNAGPKNVQKYGGIPPFRETRGYVRKILASIAENQHWEQARSTARRAGGPRVTEAAFSR